jgi:hypothetical protein
MGSGAQVRLAELYSSYKVQMPYELTAALFLREVITIYYESANFSLYAISNLKLGAFHYIQL